MVAIFLLVWYCLLLVHYLMLPVGSHCCPFWFIFVLPILDSYFVLLITTAVRNSIRISKYPGCFFFYVFCYLVKQILLSFVFYYFLHCSCYFVFQEFFSFCFLFYMQYISSFVLLLYLHWSKLSFFLFNSYFFQLDVSFSFLLFTAQHKLEPVTQPCPVSCPPLVLLISNQQHCDTITQLLHPLTHPNQPTPPPCNQMTVKGSRNWKILM